MAISRMTKVCVVGAGIMGRQIALCAALAGYEVKCTDESADALGKASAFAEDYLAGRIAKGKLTVEAVELARAKISFVPTLAIAVEDADFVIESVSESLQLKRDVFARLDQYAPQHAILATNSSYIVSSKLADATNRPDKVCNMHFFNPALVMKLVEVARGTDVSDQTIGVVMDLARSMGKVPVLLKREIYGLLVNRITSIIRREALYLCEMGVASHEDIDTAVMNGLGHPMGPFQLMDLAGIDLAYGVQMARFHETGDPAERPSSVLVEKYVKKEWGRKTGRGFYEYGSTE